jgi:hypothetical protein
MSTKSISTLEAKMTVLEAKMKLMEEQLKDLHMAGASEKKEKKQKKDLESDEDSEKAEKKQKKQKKEKDPDAPPRVLTDKQVEWNSKMGAIQPFLNEDAKKKLKEIGVKGNPALKIASYLKDKTSDAVTQEDVNDAVKHILNNPDFQTKTSKERSEKSSVASESDTEAPKKARGRPKNTEDKKAEKKVEKKAEKKAIEVVTPSDKDGNEEAEEWSWKGKEYYKLKKSNTVLDQDFDYVGVFNGKEIDENATMPASAKKYIEENLA